MFRFFQRLSFGINTVVSRSAASTAKYFDSNQRALDYFQKSECAFKEAEKYFESGDIPAATVAIKEALKNASQVGSIGPNSFMLELLDFKSKLSELSGKTAESSGKLKLNK